MFKCLGNNIDLRLFKFKIYNFIFFLTGLKKFDYDKMKYKMTTAMFLQNGISFRMKSLDNRNEAFKVPKIKPKIYLERLNLNSTQYQSDILPKLVSNFKRPANSEKQMKITSVWVINNSLAEERHIERRQVMRKNMPKLSYSVGFMYVSDFNRLRQIAETGIIENGNIKNSHLAKSSMGVSLCQFADIFHQGYSRIGVPDSGYLILVKYLKGRINYVPCDSSPMEPQPKFDCHMVKNPTVSNNSSCGKAFHQTQVFIYDYTEDGEIVNGQSKILPFAAVEFKWTGPYLYRMSKPVPLKPSIIEEVSVANHTISHTHTDNERHLSSFEIYLKDATSIIPFSLTFKGLSNINIKSHAYLYLTNPINSLLKSDNDWEISSVIEIWEFERELKRLQVNLNNVCNPMSSKDLIDPLSQDLIISLNRPNLLYSSEIDHESLHLNEFSNIPQYVTYTRIVSDSYKYSRRLTELFNLSKTMGFISRPFDSEVSILIFPDGNFSRKLGIPSLNEAYFFHGLVFHSQNPQFILINNTIEKKKEKDIYFSCLSAFKKQGIQAKFNCLQPPINLDVLKQTVKSQAEVQRTFLLNIVKPQNSNSKIFYKTICFDLDCEDYSCHYHNPIKKPRLNETTNKENIENLNMNVTQVQEKTSNGKERLCLSEKLFDYFKNNLTESVDEKIYPVINHGATKNNYFEDQMTRKCNISSASLTENERKEVSKMKIQIEYKQKNNHRGHSENVYKGSGSFRSLEFLNCCKAHYWDVNGFKTVDFPCRVSDESNNVQENVSGRLWCLNSQQFKPLNSWRGASIYK